MNLLWDPRAGHGAAGAPGSRVVRAKLSAWVAERGPPARPRRTGRSAAGAQVPQEVRYLFFVPPLPI